MIDLHSHVLPGLDDGPADIAGSVALAAEVAATGVRTLAATPHLRSDFPDIDVLGQGDRGGLVGRAIVDPGQQVRV